MRRWFSGNKIFSVGYSLILLALGSCVPSYVPNTVNMPLFSNRGEVQASIYNSSAGIDPQISFSPADHFGLMVNGSFKNQTSDSTNNFHKHNFIEFGGGYYKSYRKKIVTEIYGGIGFGNLEALYDNGFFYDYAKVHSNRIFIQPGVGFVGEVFDGGFATRFVFVQLTQGSQKASAVFIEPTVTGKIGFRQFRFVIQFGLSVPFDEQNLDFDYQPYILSLGLQGIFGRKYEDQKPAAGSY